LLGLQKKKEEEKAREKELNDLFKIAVTQPKVPVGKHLSAHGVWEDYSFSLAYICFLPSCHS